MIDGGVVLIIDYHLFVPTAGPGSKSIQVMSSKPSPAKSYPQWGNLKSSAKIEVKSTVIPSQKKVSTKMILYKRKDQLIDRSRIP